MTRYLRCINDVPIEPELPVFYFKSGKDYEVDESKQTASDSFFVIDEFKKSHLISKTFKGDMWFDNHFRLIETETKEETTIMTVWTNGRGIRKYVGQDKSNYVNDRGWYKAKAEITRVVEETEIRK